MSKLLREFLWIFGGLNEIKQKIYNYLGLL